MTRLTPQIATALEDVLPTVIDLGQATAKALALDPRDPARRQQERWANELYDRIASRARSTGIEPARLLELAGERLARISPKVKMIDASLVISARRVA